jgi:hypothetical protein
LELFPDAKIWQSISGLRKEKLGCRKLVRVSSDDKSTTPLLRLCGWHRKIVEILEIKEITSTRLLPRRAVKRGVREKRNNWKLEIGCRAFLIKSGSPVAITSDAMNGWVWEL